MQLSLTSDSLLDYTRLQLNHFFPDGHPADLRNFKGAFDTAIDRLHSCFQKVSFTRYHENGETKFNHLYADHYIVYLWFLANALWKNGADDNILNKLYYLNKTLHGFDCMFNTGLPEVFLIFHGNGTVLGKASYGNFFIAYQGCTVGMHDGKYPVIGEGVAMASNSSIIGGSVLGDKVSVGSSAMVFNAEVPAGHNVYRDKEGRIRFTKSEKNLTKNFFV